MADLLTAAKTQIGYAANTLKTDPAATLGHIVKAQGFLVRAAAPLAPVPATLDDEPPEPLSSDNMTAMAQILAATGHPFTTGPDGVPVSPSTDGVIADASPQQIRELALLGFFVQPGRYPVDYSLFEEYYEPVDPQTFEDGTTSYGGWAPKAAYGVTGPWQSYLATKS